MAAAAGVIRNAPCMHLPVCRAPRAYVRGDGAPPRCLLPASAAVDLDYHLQKLNRNWAAATKRHKKLEEHVNSLKVLVDESCGKLLRNQYVDMGAQEVQPGTYFSS
eukprot:577444-Pleurochrysis_carterae.AAC.1